MKLTLTKVLLLDIDGTVRRSKSGKPFISSPDDVEIVPGIAEAIKRFKDDGWKVYGVSNQGGVAHGYETMDTMISKFKATINLLPEDIFDDILAVPFASDGTVEPFVRRSLCRKPSYGMLAIIESFLTGIDLFPDWDNSLMVGDREEDEQCAKAANVRFMYVDEFLKTTLV